MLKSLEGFMSILGWEIHHHLQKEMSKCIDFTCSYAPTIPRGEQIRPRNKQTFSYGRGNGSRIALVVILGRDAVTSVQSPLAVFG